MILAQDSLEAEKTARDSFNELLKEDDDEVKQTLQSINEEPVVP